jgi:branched-chain amino acid transport system ATP-binding protein
MVEPTESVAPDRPVLIAEKVTRRFGGLSALTDVSFEVRQRSVTAMIGPNGAGKTTMFNILSGVFPPTGGRVRLNGADVTGWPSYRITELGLARTWQNIQLFRNLNALENVMVGRYSRTRSGLLDSFLWSARDRRERREMREWAEEILDWVGIYDRRGGC